MRHALLKKLYGFTLLEVLIVLGIVLILSYITMASYQYYVMKASRVNAKIQLFKVAAALENYYSQYYTYVGANLISLGVSPMTKDDRYQITLLNLSQLNYTIAAIPNASQQQDKRCGSLILNEKGQQSISGSGAVALCWR